MLVQIGAILYELHRAGVVLRDIPASSIYLRPDRRVVGGYKVYRILIPETAHLLRRGQVITQTFHKVSS